MKGWKPLAAGVLAAGLLISATVPANAATSHPEGGTWNYGVRWVGGSNDISYSYYQHTKRAHAATACQNNVCAPKAWRLPFTEARSEITASDFGNRAYYDVN